MCGLTATQANTTQLNFYKLMNGAKPQPLICVQQYYAMFRLYWMASHGATKSYLAWREQQQPRAAQVVHTH